MDDAVNHQIPTEQDQECRLIKWPGLSAGLFPLGVVIGKIGGEVDSGHALLGQNLFCLNIQLFGLVQVNTEGDISCGVVIVTRKQRLCRFLCYPGTGFGKVGGAEPPAA